jgi:hypothetical protein
MAAKLKTRATGKSVDEFLKGIKDDDARKDCMTLAKVMVQVTRQEPRMWGPSIVGFGEYKYRYPNGREMEWFLTGFSPRKQNLTLYMMGGFDESGHLMKQLGKHKTGKACLYIKSIDDVHMPTLKKLIKASVDRMKKVAADKR